jgi:hypothetical protein
MQAQLAASKVGVDIKQNNANARKAEADGEATFIRDTGAAKGAEVEAVGMARAKAYMEQVRALGQGPTALVNSVEALSRSGQKFVPNILLIGGGGQTLEGLAAQVMGLLETRQEEPAVAGAAAEPPPEAAPSATTSS